MIADCHMHTSFSADSETDICEQAERAIELGMSHICFTDHMDMDYPDGDFQLDSDAYVKRVLEVQEKYRDRIRICLGVEIGLQEHLKERLEAYIAAYPFDFIIGSVHLVCGEDPYWGRVFDRMGDAQAYGEYFQGMLRAVKNAPQIQTLGHLDYVVRYGKGKDREYSYQRYADEIDAVLRCIIEKGIALEVNTAGLKTLSFTNPHPDIIRRYRELGGEMITVGSDGHSPEFLGYRFEQVPELLKSCGFDYYTVFQGKKPQFIKL